MLQNLSERVRRCHERAAEAREHAEATSDPEARADFFKMERRWLLLAQSYGFAERLDDFTSVMTKSRLAPPFSPDSIVQASGAIVFAKDREGRYIAANPACLSGIGKTWSELRGRRDIEWHSDRVQARTLMSNDNAVIESEQIQVYEEALDTPFGSRIFLSTKAPLRSEDQAILGIVGISQDITERKKDEERANILESELRHRLKNMLSMIQVMARFSLRSSDGYSQFETRLVDYARSLNLLSENVETTLHQLIAAQCAAMGSRIHVAGPEVSLPPEFAIQIGIALNELITNSVKYGALGADGSVDLNWHVETHDDRKQLILQWRERHQRIQDASPRHGYGHRVLTSIVPERINGLASLEILPGELHWSLRLPLD